MIVTHDRDLIPLNHMVRQLIIYPTGNSTYSTYNPSQMWKKFNTHLDMLMDENMLKKLPTDFSCSSYFGFGTMSGFQVRASTSFKLVEYMEWQMSKGGYTNTKQYTHIHVHQCT